MEPSAPSQRRHLVAVWFADIVDYSLLASENEDEALRLVQRFQACAREAVASSNGRLVRFIADAALAEFTNTEDAARSAFALAEAFERASGMRLRVGLHVGDVARQEDGDLLGDGVNLAARLQEEAEVGEVLLSEPAWAQLRHRSGFRSRDGGRRQLKGQAEPVRVFRLIAVGPEAAGSGGELADEAAGGDRAAGRLARLQERVHELLPAGGRGRMVAWPRSIPVGLTVAGGLTLLLLLQGVPRGRAWLSGLAAGFSAPAGTGVAPADLPDFDPARVAVLYFDDHSADGSLGYLASGLTVALIDALSEVEALELVSPNGVKPFQDSNPPPDSIARALRVGSIVAGSVARSGDRVRVRVQLIDAVSGRQLGSRLVEQTSTEPLALEDSVVREVADVLRRGLGREIRLRELEHGTDSREAFDLVLRAQGLREDYVRLRAADERAARRALLRADSLLTAAEAADPRWAEPRLKRAWIARDLSLLEGPLPGRLDEAWSERALEHAERAIPAGDAAAFELRGVLRHEISNNRSGEPRRRLQAEAEADLRRAVAMDPGRALAWLALSELLVTQARFEEAAFAAEKALQADAYLADAEGTLHQIYYSSAQLGPGETSARVCQEGRRRFPRSDEFVLCRLFVLAAYPDVRPDVGHAWALVDTLLTVVPPAEREQFRAYGTMLAAQVTARAGLADSARATIRRAHGDRTLGWLAYNEAHARLLLGERDDALRLLGEWLAANDTAQVARDWWFDGLRDDPRFTGMMGRFAAGGPARPAD